MFEKRGQERWNSGPHFSSTDALEGSWRQQRTAKVPVPRFPSQADSGVFQGLVLKPRLRNADRVAICEQLLLVGGDQVCHRSPSPDVVVHPETAFHREDHPFPAVLELPIGGFAYWHAGTPSCVAGTGGGETGPKKMVHCSG